MEDSFRLLHHLIGWEGAQVEDTEGAALAVKRLREEHLRSRDETTGRMDPTGVSAIYAIAIEHYSRTGSLIPHRELNSLIRGVSQQDQALGAEANAAIAAAHQAISNGSDVPSIIERIVVSFRRESLIGTLLGASRSGIIRDDPDAALVKITSELQAIQANTHADEDLIVKLNSRQTAQARLDAYAERASNPKDHMGLQTGFAAFDRAVGGLDPGQTLLIVGQTKTGKSAFGAALACNSMLIEENAGRGCDVLIANREMQNEWQADRVEAFLMWKLNGERNEGVLPLPQPFITPEGGLSHRIRRAALSPTEWALYSQTVKDAAEKLNNKLWMVSPRAYATLDELHNIVASVKREAPLKLVFVDALNQQHLSRYNSGSHLDWAVQGDLLRRLETMAFELDVVMVVEVQEKTEMTQQRNVDLATLSAYSSDLVKAACHVLRLFRPQGDPLLVEAQMVGSRFAPSGWSFPLRFAPGDMYCVEGDQQDMQRIEGICAAGAAEKSGRRMSG